MPNYNFSEKSIIYQILTLIMEADNILDPAEVLFLDRVFDDFSLNVNEFDHMEELDFEQLTKAFSLFTEEKKEYAINLFWEMARCDGSVDPREEAVINKIC